MTSELNSGYQRLEDQIHWYGKKSMLCRRWHMCLKLTEIVSAAGIPFAAPHDATVAAGLGALVVILEGAQYLAQFERNWISYRSTCEALRHEKYLFLAGAGHYEAMDKDSAMKLLACSVESLISTEHARWLIGREKVREKAADTHR